MKEIICSKECIQFQKGYCYIAEFGKPCGKQKFTYGTRKKNNASRKAINRSRY